MKESLFQDLHGNLNRCSDVWKLLLNLLVIVILRKLENFYVNYRRKLYPLKKVQMLNAGFCQSHTSNYSKFIFWGDSHSLFSLWRGHHCLYKGKIWSRMCESFYMLMHKTLSIWITYKPKVELEYERMNDICTFVDFNVK